jgi:histidinol phosphatase-like PHP family hydrolase
VKITRRINLHIHSNYSDGKNSIEEIIKSAINANLEYIAITDHFSNSWKAKIIPTLNSREKIDIYLDEIGTINNQLRENNENLVVLRGIEIDLSSSHNYISNLIKPHNFDLILFEYLETPEAISFLKNIIYNWKESYNITKIPLLGLAHFDPSFFIFSNMEVLLPFMTQFKIFLELNSSYPQYYSTKYMSFFQKIKERKIAVSIGCDSHNLSNVGDIEDPFIAIENYDLMENFRIFLAELERRFKT